MRANGWRGNSRGPRRKPVTTTPDPGNPRHPDLVKRDFRAQRPGQLLVADFTYVPLAGGGFGYTAFVFDAFAGTILGWECSLSKATAFVQRAIGQAAAALRRAAGGPITWRAVHHSDAGSQYTSLRFTETLALARIAPSIGTVGDAYDNALAETLIGLYKSEAVRDGSPFRDGPAPPRAAAPGRGRRRALGQPGLTPDSPGAAGLDMGPSRGAATVPCGQATKEPGPEPRQGYGPPPHVKPGSPRPASSPRRPPTPGR